MNIRDLIEGLRIFQEYDNNAQVVFFEDEVRVKLQQGVILGVDDLSMLNEFGWVFSEDEWVRWI